MKNNKTPVDLSIQAFGGVRRMARAIDCDPATVIRWKKNGKIPAPYQETVLKAVWATGTDMTAHEIIFGRAE